MTRNSTKTAPALTVAEIQARGRALQQRFRDAGIPQYTRWLIDQYPSLGTDTDTMNRMRQLFNGAGARRDQSLLEKCEALADRFMTNKAA